MRLGQIELSFSELDASSARVAALLSNRGVRPGDRIGVMLGQVAELPGVYYGVLRAGAVVVPIDTSSTALQVGSALEQAGAQVVFAWHECLDVAEAGARHAGADYIVVHPASFGALLDAVQAPQDTVERGPEDVAVLLYETHAIELTHAELVDRLMPLKVEDKRC